MDDKKLESIISSRKKGNNRGDAEVLTKKILSAASPEFSNKFRIRDQIYITEIGLVLMIIYCFISGLSGVYNEYLLKLNFSDSIYVQNIYLYLYGCLFNFIAHILENHFDLNSNNFSNKSSSDFFNGFNIFTWTIIFTQVFNGLTMSIVMKHSNNITRLFVISSSLVVTILFSIFLFSIRLNIYFYFCFCTILVALYAYVL